MTQHVPQSVWDKIEKQVTFQNDAQKATFLADAMNTYVALGQMIANGKKIFVGPDPDDLARIHLPFEQAANTAKH